MRRALTLVLTLLIATTALAAAPAADKPLTRRQQKDLVAKLPEQHRQFLMDVEPILVQSERETFLRLETDPQRDAFIDDFWRRRDAAAGTSPGVARDDYYQRLDFVKENFEGTSSDRGRILLIHGMPEALLDIDCKRIFQPLQVWRYQYIEGLGHNVRILFYLPKFQTRFKLWNPMGGALALKDLESNDITAGGVTGSIRMECDHADELQKALGQMQADVHRIGTIFEPPKVNSEEVSRILRSVVLPDAKAPKLDAEISVTFPGGDGSRTDAQMTLLVPRAKMQTTEVSGVAVYSLDVVGEVLRDGKMWEKYRYRFDYPADIKDEKLPVVINRMLRPATYLSRIKVSDPVTRAESVLETPLVVPEVAKAEKVTEESTALRAIHEELQSTRASLRIVPLGDDVTSGLQTIQTMVSGAGITAVEFWLDGKKVATRRAPPYTLDLDFGTVPRARTVRVVALDSHGAPITGDEIVVNSGTDPFRVRIVSPRIAPKLSGPTRVELEVRVPQGKALENVQLYWNETRVATLFDPPFVQTVNIPAGESVGYLRAVATLKEAEADPAEDVVMVNTPDFMETIDVHLVELPTTVSRDGKLVNDLGESAFRVFDEGQPVKLAKFEHVKDLPLSIGMAVDNSGSMEPRMNVVREAGAAFFKNVMRKHDKAFLVAFDSQPHIVMKWSPDLSDIYSGLAKMRPEESTALYDAVVYSLYNFLGVKGQRALVVITDGKDTASKFSFEQALEYAQRAAVPIYAIGIGIRGAELDVKSRMNRLCSETGGSVYYIDNAEQLAGIYSEIENELRSQYVLGFYPPAEVKSGGKWREVRVETAEGKVRTIRGYYP